MRRIQRKRTGGWRKPANCVYVGRGSDWGNDAKISEKVTREQAIEAFREKLSLMDEPLLRIWLKPLHGKDICCWCREDEACHGDVLIELCKRLGVE